MSIPLVQAEWPAPMAVRAFTTTRQGGVSEAPWRSFNLGMKCGDDGSHVAENRARLGRLLPAEPQWLTQVHGTRVLRHDGGLVNEPEGDALVTFEPGRVCAVLTADCLPVFFCNRRGNRAALTHAGWRGLAAGVLESTVDALDERPERLLAWLGPAIGPSAYEVGNDVRERFPGHPDEAFRPHGDRWLMDMYCLARQQLEQLGVEAVYGGTECTFSDEHRFFSYRRDGVTGRMASLIWIEGR